MTKHICLVCLKGRSDYICIYDNGGSYDMELFNITRKYFGTKLFEDAEENELSVVCSECWQFMSEFYDFQKLIIKTHKQFANNKLKILKTNWDDQIEIIIEMDETSNPKQQESMVDETKTDIETKPIIETNIARTESDGNSIATINDRIKLEPEDETFKADTESKSLVHNNIVPTEISSCYENDRRKLSVKLEPIEDMSITEQPDEYISDNESNIALIDANILDAEKTSESETFHNSLSDTLKMEIGETTITEQMYIPADLNIVPSEIDCSNENSQEFNDLGSSNQNCLENGNISDEHFVISYITEDQSCTSPSNTSTSKNVLQSDSECKNNVVCSICNKSLTTLTALKYHARRNHPNEKYQALCCPRLPPGVQPINLNKPKIMFKCNLCGKFCKTKVILGRHKAQDHARVYAPPVQCRFCDKTYERKDRLEEHEANHAGIRLYKCLICTISFQLRTSLYRHFKSVHPEEWAMRLDGVNPGCGKVNLDTIGGIFLRQDPENNV